MSQCFKPTTKGVLTSSKTRQLVLTFKIKVYQFMCILSNYAWYVLQQVSYFEMAGYKPGGSSTIALLTDMGQKTKTIRQLVVYLRRMGNLDALEILAPLGETYLHVLYTYKSFNNKK